MLKGANMVLCVWFYHVSQNIIKSPVKYLYSTCPTDIKMYAYQNLNTCTHYYVLLINSSQKCVSSYFKADDHYKSYKNDLLTYML